MWQHGDAIGVFGSASGTNVCFQTEEGAISSDGKSTVFETSETAPEGELTGYYPYQQGAALISGGVLQLTMPATQSYDTNQTGVVRPDPAVNMMAGKICKEICFIPLEISSQARKIRSATRCIPKHLSSPKSDMI